MKLIAHRGNIKGPNPSLENTPSYIHEALSLGFDAEIDVWLLNGNYMLGHDSPDFFVKESFLESPRLWCHAKNLEALESMLKNDKIHCFWHQSDDATLTSRGYIRTYPGKPICSKSVIVDLDSTSTRYNCYGVCADSFNSSHHFDLS